MSLVAIAEIVKSGFKNVAAKTCDMNTVHIQVRLLNTITAERKVLEVPTCKIKIH